MSLFSSKLGLSSIGNDSVISNNIDIPSVSYSDVDAPYVPMAFDGLSVNGNSSSFSGMDADSNPNNDMMCKDRMNTMPPPPRTQNISYPIETTNSPRIPINPYKTGRKNNYMFSPEQNVQGVVTNNVGRDDLVRGNEFSRSYDWNNIHGRPKKQIVAPEINRRAPTVQLKSPFYPEPSRELQKDALYKTYPRLDMRQQQTGQPQFKDPYDNVLDSPTTQTIESFKNEDDGLTTLQMKNGSKVADMTCNGFIIGSLATLFYVTFMKK